MRRACFFSREGLEQLFRQQYSVQDIKILRELGYEVTIASRFSEIPWGVDLYFGWWASGSVMPLVVAKFCGKPLVVVAGGNEALLYRDSLTGEPGGYLAAPLYKRLATQLTLRMADEVLVVSKFMQAGIPKVYDRAVHVVYNSIDTELFSYSAGARPYVSTILGTDPRVARLKRAEVLMRAVPLVLTKFPEQRFIVIGSRGQAEAGLRRLLDDLGVSASVEFIGACNNQQIVTWLQRSSAYVQISDTETFGVAIGEAMSCGAPVIVSKQGAIPEVVGDCGVYVDHNSPESVADGIVAALSLSTQQRDGLANRARMRIMSQFSYANRKSAIQSILQRLE